MLPSFCRDAVTVRRAARTVSRGSSVMDWDAASEHVLKRCSVQPAQTVRTTGDRTLAIADGATLYAPFGADVEAGDRIEFEGAVYEVDGSPMTYRSATGAVSHMEVPLKLWRG